MCVNIQNVLPPQQGYELVLTSLSLSSAVILDPGSLDVNALAFLLNQIDLICYLFSPTIRWIESFHYLFVAVVKSETFTEPLLVLLRF